MRYASTLKIVRAAQFMEFSSDFHHAITSVVEIHGMTIIFIAAFLLFILLGIVTITLGRKIAGFSLLGIALFTALAFGVFLMLVERSGM